MPRPTSHCAGSIDHHCNKNGRTSMVVDRLNTLAVHVGACYSMSVLFLLSISHTSSCYYSNVWHIKRVPLAYSLKKHTIFTSIWVIEIWFHAISFESRKNSIFKQIVGRNIIKWTIRRYCFLWWVKKIIPIFLTFVTVGAKYLEKWSSSVSEYKNSAEDALKQVDVPK